MGGIAIVRWQHFSPPQREAGRSSGEGLFFEESAVQCGAAHAAIARACLPRTAPGDVGAVHHDISLNALTIS
jgi:hypothetical protein